jgi:histone H3/H4
MARTKQTTRSSVTKTPKKDSGIKKKKKDSKPSKKESDNNKTEKNRKEEQYVNKNGFGNIRKPFRFKPGTVALREIRKQQKSTDNVIPLAPFSKLVKEIAHEQPHSVRLVNDSTNSKYKGVKFQRGALNALLNASESYLVKFLEMAYNISISNKRVTLMTRDTKVIKNLVGIATTYKENSKRDTFNSKYPNRKPQPKKPVSKKKKKEPSTEQSNEQKENKEQNEQDTDNMDTQNEDVDNNNETDNNISTQSNITF